MTLFIGITLFLFGIPAFATGQALAATWRSAGWVAVYCLMLGLADRFIVWSLFQSDLSSLGGYVIDSAALVTIGMTAYGITRARKMVTQYPWLYQSKGLFGWRRIDGA